MAQFVNIYPCDLRKGPVETSLRHMYLGDVEANRVGVNVTDGGEAVALSGTCSGTAILCNGGTVALTGVISGNQAYIDMPAAVYTVEGPVEIYLAVTTSGVTTTLLHGHGNAVRTDSGIVIDPGTIIPSVSALISDIDDAVASIPADYSDLLGTIAPDFSSSTAYTAGQYVWYSGTLYRFTSDHAAGSWTGTDAISAEIGEDVADLKGAITPYHEDSMVATRAYTSGDILMVGPAIYKAKRNITSGTELTSTYVSEITLREYLSGTGLAFGNLSHAEGDAARASGTGAHAEGYKTVAGGNYSHAEGKQTSIMNGTAHAEGISTQADGNGAHAEGLETIARSGAHSEGYKSEASGANSHAEGHETTASGAGAHAEGDSTVASGSDSHAEGASTTASNMASHAEGGNTIASGTGAHAEGNGTTASGICSHAEGAASVASGTNSHAEGESTIANHRNQHVFGSSNVADPSSAVADDPGTYVEIVGNGGSTDHPGRSNARTLDWDGNEALAGNLTLGMGTADEVTITAAQLKQLLALLN